MMKKILAIMLTTILIVGLAACSSNTDNTAADADSGSGGSRVTVEVQIVETDWSDSWDEMKEKFESQYPDIELVLATKGGAGESNNDFIATRAAADDLPAVIQLDNGTLYRSLTDEGKIVDLKDYPAAANIPQSYLDAFTYNGVLMGITQGSAFSVLYLNMDILGEAGWDAPPTNWDEFIQVCKDIQDNTGIAPLTLAGDKTTTCWMLYECILGNVCGDELGFGVYEEQFLDGTFDFSSYTRATQMLAEVAPYMMTGTASMGEDDVTAAVADGSVAMALAGNWTATNICDAIASNTGNESSAVAILPPFNEAGKGAWISVSPETSFALTAQDDPEVRQAADTFFNWVFEAENFAIIQNARGTVPVLTTMTEDQIVLPDAISAIVEPMNQADYVKMGFNLWTEEFEDSACTMLRDVYANNMTAEDAASSMWDTLQRSHVN